MKRVGAVGRDEMLLTSDAPGHECLFVARAQVIGRVALRYWPLLPAALRARAEVSHLR